MKWRYRENLLALAVVANFSQVGARLVISPLVPEIIRSFSVSKGTMGLALTGMWAAFALMQFPSGLMSDKYGERRVILTALLFTGVCSVLLAAAPSILFLGLFAVFLGAGAGLYFSPGTSLLTKQFENTGQALGIHSAGSPLAGLTMPLAAVYLAGYFGWRAAFLLGATASIGALVLFANYVRPLPAKSPNLVLRSQVSPSIVLERVSRPRVAFTIVIATVCMYSFQSFASFFPTFLIEYRGFSTELASLAFTVAFVLSGICQPFMGRLSDTVLSRDTTLVFSLSIMALGFGLLLFGGGTLHETFAGVFVLGIGLSWPGVLNSRIMDNFSDEERGAGFGLVRTAFVLPGALGNVVTGSLADIRGWPVAFGVVVGLIILTVIGILSNRVLGLDL